MAAVRKTAFVISLDRGVYEMAMNLSYPQRWIAFWEAVAGFGSGWFVFPVLGFAALPFLFKRHGARDFAAVFFMIFGSLLNTALKFRFRLDRPVSLSPYSDLVTYSFPSGHAFNSVLLFYFLPKFWEAAFPRKPGERGTSVFLTAFGIALIGMSRVFLGAHWFSDVIGGWLLGFAVSETFLAVIGQKDAPHEEKI